MLIASIVATVISACLVHGTRTVSFDLHIRTLAYDYLHLHINLNHVEPEVELELKPERWVSNPVIILFTHHVL